MRTKVFSSLGIVEIKTPVIREPQLLPETWRGRSCLPRRDSSRRLVVLERERLLGHSEANRWVTCQSAVPGWPNYRRRRRVWRGLDQFHADPSSAVSARRTASNNSDGSHYNPG